MSITPVCKCICPLLFTSCVAAPLASRSVDTNRQASAQHMPTGCPSHYILSSNCNIYVAIEVRVQRRRSRLLCFTLDETGTVVCNTLTGYARGSTCTVPLCTTVVFGLSHTCIFWARFGDLHMYPTREGNWCWSLACDRVSTSEKVHKVNRQALPEAPGSDTLLIHGRFIFTKTLPAATRTIEIYACQC